MVTSVKAGLPSASYRGCMTRLRSSSPATSSPSAPHLAFRWSCSAAPPAHSSLCSQSTAPTSRTMLSRFGKMPTTSVRRRSPGSAAPAGCCSRSGANAPSGKAVKARISSAVIEHSAARGSAVPAVDRPACWTWPPSCRAERRWCAPRSQQAAPTSAPASAGCA